MTGVVLALLAQAVLAQPRDLQTLQIVLLTKGPAWTADTTSEVQSLQRAHATYLSGLSISGRLAVGGTFAEAGDLRAMLVLKVPSEDEARAIAAAAPAVKAGRLAADVWSLTVAGNWFAVGLSKEDAATRRYVLGFLDAASPPSLSDDDTQARLELLWRLRDAGALVLCGELHGAAPHRGLVVLAVDSVPAARALLAADPALAVGRYSLALHPWYAPEGALKIAK
jgi:uncharacterized protein YciI